jgi:hypothetical protein
VELIVVSPRHNCTKAAELALAIKAQRESAPEEGSISTLTTRRCSEEDTSAQSSRALWAGLHLNNRMGVC